MRNTWKIFLNDLKQISSNWVAAILIGGLIFLPSLYAWLNIYASWDPYGNTDQLPVAIVNEDIGENVRDEDIHVGDSLVDTLKDSDAMDWKFVTRDTAMNELEKGNYFAVIIIPENFSKNLGTVVTKKPKKATVEYYVNEKINAISPKITQKGASVIVEEVSSEFISTVNGIIFDVFNKIGVEIEKDLPDIKRLENYVFELQDRMPEIHQILDESLTDATSAQNIVSKAQDEIPKAESILTSGSDTIVKTTQFIDKTEEKLNEINPMIKEGIEKVEQSATEINNFVQEVDSHRIDLAEGNDLKEKIEGKVDESIDELTTVQESIQYLIDQIQETDEPNTALVEHLANQMEMVNDLKTQLTEGKETTQSLEGFFEDKTSEVDNVFDTIKELSSGASEKTTQLLGAYQDIEPNVLEEIKSAKQTLGNAKGLIEDIQSNIPEVKRILTRTNKNLTTGKGSIEDVLGEYPFIHEKINELASKIETLQSEADLSEIIKLLQNDPEAERSFFAEPVQLNEHKLFPIENYGTGMTPFYTVLSLWVGGLLLISLLSTSVTNPEIYHSKEIYFGKLFTFLFAGILQASIVSLGDIFILKVNIAHPVMFVLFAIFISFVFISLIYTFVSIFGDVGKAIAIVALVLQIAGAGGTYPVVLLPKFFQTISPLLPFTYAVDLMREAVGGIVWENVMLDLVILLAFASLAMIAGSLFKQAINRHTEKVSAKAKTSGLFH